MRLNQVLRRLWQPPAFATIAGLPPILGATSAPGRLFTKLDDSPDAHGTVILMAGDRRTRFGPVTAWRAE